MIESKLFCYKNIKVNGVRFTISKLSPSLFMDKDYLFPMSNVIEKKPEDKRDKKAEKELADTIDKFKDKIKDTLLISVKKISTKKYLIFKENESIDVYIDKIMDNPELYSYLFSEIVSYSLGLKKKLKNLFKLTDTSQKLFT